MSATFSAAIETDGSPVSAEADAAPPDYVLIAGLGRSGTNWLLDLFDLSADTFCRNEPNVIEGSPFEVLKASQQVPGATDLDPEAWDRAVALTAMRMGERDHPNHGRKRFFHPICRLLKLHRLIQRPRPRSWLARTMPSLRQGEWPMPRWLGSETKLREARVILKMLRSPAWMAWVLSHRPNVQVIHIVRHPGGFLNSYRNRYLERRDRDRVTDRSRLRLLEIAGADPDWARRFGEVERLDVVDLELWYWLYHTETLHIAAGSAPGRYRRVVYERLADDPAGHIAGLYADAGLTWNDAMAARAGKLLHRSSDIADKWRTQLSSADREAVERILDRTARVNFWEGSEASGS